MPHDETYQLYQRLMEAGFGEDDIKRLRSDSAYAKTVYSLVDAGGITVLSEPEQMLSRIFGRGGYFGIRDWSKYLWVTIAQHNLANFPELSWPYEIFDQPCPFYPGKTIKETHAVFLGLFGDKGSHGQFYLGAWDHLLKERRDGLIGDYGHRLFLEIKGDALDNPPQFRWYLMLIGTVPNSIDKLYKRQFEMLPPEYEIPSPTEMVLSKVCFFIKVGRLHQPGDASFNRCLTEQRAPVGGAVTCVNHTSCPEGELLQVVSSTNICMPQHGIYASRKPGQ